MTPADPLTTSELDQLRTVLRSALVSDALDAIGLRNQTLGADISRLAGRDVLVGRAYTVAVVPVDAVPEVAYVGLRHALEELGRDDVYVCATGRSERYAAWGELTSMAAQAAGAVGFVTDGMIRDLPQVERLAFSVFARGTTPRDINGRAELVGHGEAIAIDRIAIRRGDVIVADRDGVVVVPSGVAREVVDRALVKAAAEASFQAAVADGLPVTDALTRFEVL